MLTGSEAGGGWILILVDEADMCSPGAPTGGPEPIVVVGTATLIVEAVAEALWWGAMVDGAFASLEAQGLCTLAPFTDCC